MTIGSWIYNKVTSSTNINAIISSNCKPDIADYKIPGVFYQVLSQGKNRLFRSPVVSVKCIESSQDKCEVLNDLLLELFCSSTSRVYGVYGDMKVESVEFANNIPSYYDKDNKLWLGVLDFKVNYIK